MTHEAALLTTAEVAEQLRVHPATIRRWAESGVLVPAFVTPGGHYRFTRESIAAAGPSLPPAERSAS